MTGIEHQGVTSAFLFRSSEPIDWQRSSLSLSQTSLAVPPPPIPEAVKLVSATLGAQQPRDESLSLLMRQSLDLSGYRIKKRDLSRAPLTDSLPPALDKASSTWVPVYEFDAESVA